MIDATFDRMLYADTLVTGSHLLMRDAHHTQAIVMTLASAAIWICAAPLSLISISRVPRLPETCSSAGHTSPPSGT